MGFLAANELPALALTLLVAAGLAWKCPLPAAIAFAPALLATVPTLSRIGPEAGVEGDFWRFTRAGASRLFSCVFDACNVEAQAHGNVLTGLAFWVGMAIEEVSSRARELEDPNFPLLVTVKAVKR